MSNQRLRSRRGSALILVLLMTLAVAALAVAAIFMSSSASLLSRFYDRERQFAYAAESGIQRVLSRLTTDTTFRIVSANPGAPVLDLVEVSDATGVTIDGARVRVWAARTFDTSSTGPVTVSLLAQVVDASGTRFARRVDIRQDAYTTFTLATDSSAGAGFLGLFPNMPFASDASVPGRVYANGNWGALGGSPVYRDSLLITGTSGENANRFRTGKFEGVRRVQWPAVDSIRIADSVAASAQGRAISVNASYPTRLEFFVRDDNGDGVIGANEGYLRIFELRGGDVQRLRAAFDSDEDETSDYYRWDRDFIQNQCGAFYHRNGRWRFFPVATHRASWAWSIIDSAAGIPGPPSSVSWNNDNNRRDATRAILRQPTARCFPAGSPYLLHTELFTNNGGQPSTNANQGHPYGVKNAAHQLGGLDSVVSRFSRTCTFDWSTSQPQCTGQTSELGEWRQFGSSIEMSLDTGSGAVVYVDRSVYVHGTIAGRVKLFVNGTATIIDRILHAAGANDSESTCEHLFGLVARDDIVIDDNSVSARRRVGSAANPASASWVVLGGEERYSLYGSYFALTGTLRAAGASRRIGNANDGFDCEGSTHAGGCLTLTGSVAMRTTSALSARSSFFGNANGNGFRLTPSVDACLERGYRPPNYPLTNRYRMLRAVNVRPAQIIGENGIASYFAQLQGRSDIQ